MASQAESLWLCIITPGYRLRGRDLVECLQESMDPDDKIQTILDRRQPHSATEMPRHTAGPFRDRRQHHLVDIALRIHGFALVAPHVADPLRMGQQDLDA